FTTKKPDPAAPAALEAPPTTLTVKAGLNRVVWNLRHDQAVPVPGLYVFGTLQGRRVLPGNYQVRLTAGGKTLTAPLTVRMDPRVDTPLTELQTQDSLSMKATAQLDELHRTVIRLRDARSQIEGLMKRTKGASGGEAIEQAGQSLVDKLNALEETLVQKRVVDGQTVINFPQRLNQYFIYLRSAIDGSDAGITDGQQARLAALSEEWARQQRTAGTLFGDEVAAFNRLVRDRNVPAVVVK
ncbi:MAG TPA: hypothetical protein VMW48_20915, partial [Vicinamibacterales bacterium]|nr:hypothetical protein [Vicinamibacterales bacterium]